MFATRPTPSSRPAGTVRRPLRARRTLAALAVAAVAATTTACAGVDGDAARAAVAAAAADDAAPTAAVDEAPGSTTATSPSTTSTTDDGGTEDGTAGDGAAGGAGAGASPGIDPADDPVGEPDPDGHGVPEGPVGFTVSGGSPVPPVHPVPEAPAPSWGEVVLAPIAQQVPTQDLAPLPEPLPEPVPVPAVAPVGTGAPGGLTGNLVGCAANCLTQAVLTYQQGTPDLEFTSATNVAATVSVWIRTTPPVMTPQGPRYTTGSPTATSPAGTTSWTTQLPNLTYDTFYYVIVRATDQYGNSRWASTSLTTASAPGPDQLSGNETGCAIGCITSAIVTPGAAYHHVHLDVTTDTAAEIRVAVSTQLPGWIGPLPVLPEDEQFDVTATTPTSVSGDIVSLDGSTTYYVLVKATDVNGATSWAAGEFTTAPVPPRVVTPDDVFISLERVEFLHDGDPQPGNRGEGTMAWQIGPDVIGRAIDLAKFEDGMVVELPDDAGTWVSVDPGADLPLVLFNVEEIDTRYLAGDGYEVGMCWGGLGEVKSEPTYNDECDSRTNVAGLGGVDVEWISTLMPCSWFLLSGVLEQDRCIELRSATMNDDYPDFKVLVRFRVG